jgi:hypothetical protein
MYYYGINSVERLKRGTELCCVAWMGAGCVDGIDNREL